jgi:signal transduction histidine kinase
MAPVDDSPPDEVDDPTEQLRHDLKSPLTTISGRAQLLARSVRRSSSLSDEERVRMLDGLAVIETAILALVTHIDAMGREDENSGGDTEQQPGPRRE